MADTLVPRTFEKWQEFQVIPVKPDELKSGFYLLKGQIVIKESSVAFDKDNHSFSVVVAYSGGSMSSRFSLQLRSGQHSELEKKVADALCLPDVASYNDSLVGVHISQKGITRKVVNYLRIPGILEAVIIQGKVGPYKQLSPVNVAH